MPIYGKKNGIELWQNIILANDPAVRVGIKRFEINNGYKKSYKT